MGVGGGRWEVGGGGEGERTSKARVGSSDKLVEEGVVASVAVVVVGDRRSGVGSSVRSCRCFDCRRCYPARQ